MDELLEFLKSFNGGEVALSYNKLIPGWEITASKGRFSKSICLAEAKRLDLGECATLLSLRAIRVVKEAVNLDRANHADENGDTKLPETSDEDD